MYCFWFLIPDAFCLYALLPDFAPFLICVASMEPARHLCSTDPTSLQTCGATLFSTFRENHFVERYNQAFSLLNAGAENKNQPANTRCSVFSHHCQFVQHPCNLRSIYADLRNIFADLQSIYVDLRRCVVGCFFI